MNKQQFSEEDLPESYLSAIFAEAQVGLSLLSSQGVFLRVNNTLCRILGHARESLLHSSFAAVTHEEDLPPCLEAFHQLLKDGQPVSIDKRYLRLDGTVVWANSALSLLQVKDKAPLVLAVTVDLTERKKNEEALRASEINHARELEKKVEARTAELKQNQAMLQAIIDAPHIGIAVYRALRNDADKIYDFSHEFINRRTREALGKDYTGERLQAVSEKISAGSPSSLDDIFALLVQVIDSGEPQRCERYYHDAYLQGWYVLSIVKLGDGAVVTWKDINERKLATEKVNEQAHFISRVSETIPDTVTVTEVPSGKQIYINRDPLENYGFDKQTIQHLSTEERYKLIGFHPDDASKLLEYYRSAVNLTPNHLHHFTYRAKYSTDSWKWFEVRGSVFQQEKDGRTSKVINVIRDITAQKEAEYQLNESKELLQSVIDSCLSSIHVLQAVKDDRGNIHDFRFVLISNEGRSGEQAYKGKLYSEVYPDLLNSETYRKFIDVVETGKRVEYDLLDDQENRWYHVVVVKLGDGFVSAARDITEHKKNEEELLKLKLRQQKEILNTIIITQEQERERIGEALHNSLAQLLYGIQMRLHLLLPDTEEQQKYKQELLTITADAINEARGISFELVPAVLKDYGIEEALLSLFRRIIKHQPVVQLKLTGLDQRLPEKVEFAIYRIVQELVNNIIKHAQATEASVHISIQRKKVVLKIADNGVGIDKKAFAHKPNGIGIQSIKNRLRLLEGQFKIRAGKPGTLVYISIPL